MHWVFNFTIRYIGKGKYAKKFDCFDLLHIKMNRKIKNKQNKKMCSNLTEFADKFLEKYNK
ncbi:hypothetical protein CFB3_38940 [Clostridium folliculivorans]|uniref:Uncharacterized protein n=1 Tax=Clostridium folliculivorans TaxID=2886038 RepID=A0A9W5Y732_9CLOT|nr:hypothetical protein CFOLD11_45970 [Clostridium folliculivorans]GKU31787.1 hypothetical protein CFB3_38940 [Clostridium folliculivorans]